MNGQMPIFTEKTRCQDCYKCVRQCPVKAIRVQEGSAAVIPERCVFCGTCVNVCPVGAKKVRDDLYRAKFLVKRRPVVIASLAPSFAAEFPGIPAANLVRAIKALGFTGVSETALGAQQVTGACAGALARDPDAVMISSACPTAVELIRKYHPQHLDRITPFLSPLLAHCRLLRRTFGEDAGVVFFGPCISKKLEADRFPHLLDVALTFTELRRWFEERGIDPAAMAEGDDGAFVPEAAAAGALYPMDGGMARGVRAAGIDGVRYMAFSGIHYSEDALRGLDEGARGLFMELLACEGGCVNGPQASRTCGTAVKWMRVLDRHPGEPVAPEPPEVDLAVPWIHEPVPTRTHTPAEIRQALRQVGKTTPEDLLNCGGCGYDACEALAAALLDGRAEPGMCVSHMRKLAMNKANALIRAMPSGVVIADENLSIIECNQLFAELMGPECALIYEAKPGMEGASLAKVAPFSRLFREALEGNGEPIRKDLRVGDRIIRLMVFPIESGRMAGGILQDITEPAVEREQIIQKTQDVIRKNVTTVQQIAYLLGENAAETELILGSIVESFQLPPVRKREGER
ncbi:[Fe-Fe] hydrogenase large subunit C-terminal domain-containing protein [Mesoterricola sediminis]|uniref:Hydrogenase n=1 Tax=Mesoterricola sediminis TaxID=2927980 RepID=A0AA48GLS7_9BACT|nr:[Fe-Fe] hydrogenase large subunit C-terminal domain-containing protein [Mesoterricola sediminis]BDU75431.1 hydrogenase [Mesoterricola sediminis]